MVLVTCHCCFPLVVESLPAGPCLGAALALGGLAANHVRMGLGITILCHAERLSEQRRLAGVGRSAGLPHRGHTFTELATDVRTCLSGHGAHEGLHKMSPATIMASMNRARISHIHQGMKGSLLVLADAQFAFGACHDHGAQRFRGDRRDMTRVGDAEGHEPGIGGNGQMHLSPAPHCSTVAPGNVLMNARSR